MQIVLDFPVNARANSVDGRKVNAFGLMPHSFEIRELPNGSLPLVVEFSSGRVSDPKVRYRQDPTSGQYYRSGGTVMAASKSRELTSSWDGQPNFAALRSRRSEEHRILKENGQAVIPETRSPSFHNGDFPACDQVNQSDVARCLEEAQEFLSQCLVVEKTIWVPCSEPVFKVSRGNEYWGLTLDNHQHYSADWHVYIFSIDEFEEAGQWIDVLNEELGERPKRAATMIVQNALVSKSGAVEDAVAMTRQVMSKVACIGENLADQSPEVIRMYADLKAFVCADTAEMEPDDVDRAFDTILRLCDMDAEGTLVMKRMTPELKLEQQYRRDYPLHRLRGAVELHHRKWQDRGISVGLADNSAFRPRPL